LGCQPEPLKKATHDELDRGCPPRAWHAAPRRLIAQVIADADDHSDVAELHRRDAERNSRVLLATVYRTVKCFQHASILDRISTAVK
jgi:Fur family ferric uptake transcriptional regulator